MPPVRLEAFAGSPFLDELAAHAEPGGDLAINESLDVEAAGRFDVKL